MSTYRPWGLWCSRKTGTPIATLLVRHEFPLVAAVAQTPIPARLSCASQIRWTVRRRQARALLHIVRTEGAQRADLPR